MNQENNNKTWSMLVGSLIGLIVISLVASFAIILSSSTTNSNTTKEKQKTGLQKISNNKENNIKQIQPAKEKTASIDIEESKQDTAEKSNDEITTQEQVNEIKKEIDDFFITTKIIHDIINKIESNPNSICGVSPCIIATKKTEIAEVEFIYSFTNDPLDNSSNKALVVEIISKVYFDSNGIKYNEHEITEEYFVFRDFDFDGIPDDYWSSDFGPDLDFKILDVNNNDSVDLFRIWEFGISYFINKIK